MTAAGDEVSGAARERLQALGYLGGLDGAP